MRFILSVFAVLVFMFTLFGCSDDCDVRETKERNKATILRVHHELTQGNAAIMDEVLAENYVRHCQAMPPELQTLTDKEIFKGFLIEWVDNISDYRDTITNMVAEGNKVAYVSTMTAIHSGPIGDLPATGKPFELVNIIIHRFNEEGKIAETWVSWDNLAFLQQVGLFPPPPPVEPEG